MTGTPNRATEKQPKVYLYYRCHAGQDDNMIAEHDHFCTLPRFRADQVDGAVWGWMKEFLTNPAALERGLRESQAERNRDNEPLRRRLAVVDDLLTDNRQELGRLLDLYLAGDFPKEVLTDRKARLETTIRALKESGPASWPKWKRKR